MKKIILILLLSLLVLSLTGCSREENISNSNINDGYEEKQGLFTNTIEFGEGESFYGNIKKHKSSKTAEINAFMSLNDTDEVSEFMGEDIYLAPMMINMMCNFMDLTFFSPEDLKSSELEVNIEDNDLWKNIDGYDISEISITFIDKESSSNIAKCVSTGKDMMEYYIYRDYPVENSFLGIEIGIFE